MRAGFLSRLEGRDLAKVLARKAEGDARVARKLAPDPDIDDEAVGFHAQQAVEKWLKAVMALRGLEEARIHDLRARNAPKPIPPRPIPKVTSAESAFTVDEWRRLP